MVRYLSAADPQNARGALLQHGVHRLNQDVVRCQLPPRESELQALLESLNGSRWCLADRTGAPV